MKELKDYLHLYLGAQYKITWIANDRRPRRYKPTYISASNLYNILKCLSAPKYYSVKLFLRPLSNMTDDEMKELYLWVFKRPFVGDNITHRDIGKEQERKVLWSGCDRLFVYKDGDVGADSDLQYYPIHAPSIVLWKLSKHFDLFELIPAGLAIDKTLITKP